MLKLFDLFPDWLNGDGIFNYMTGDLPWDTANAVELNIIYFSRSGGKNVSSLLNHLQTDKTLTAENKQRIADILLLQFLPKWQKIWNTIIAEYDPLKNYNVTESDEKITNFGKQISDRLTKLGTITKTRGLTVSDVSSSDDTGGNTQINYQHGFNSTTQQETSKATNQSTVVTSNTSTETHSGSDTDEFDTTDNRVISDSGSDVTSNENSKSGIMGVSNQDLIEQERRVQSINFFNDYVFPDIDKVLTLQVY